MRHLTPGNALICLALLLLVAQALAMGWCFQDDAFISLRFSRNLAAGEGLVFNTGEAVEGYTNFLWTVLASVPFLAGWDELVFLWWAGLISGCAAVLGAGALAYEVAETRVAAGFAAVLAASLPFLAAESVMGLETCAFAALGAWSVAIYLRERTNPSQRPWSGLLMAASALMRPEGVLIAALVFGFDLLPRSSQGPGWRSVRSWVRLMLFAAPVAAHLLFRVATYGDIVPNTFHAKVGGGFDMLTRGLRYTGEFSLVTAPLLLLALAGVWVLLKMARSVRDPQMLVFIVPLLFVAYVSYVGGDYKPTYRFFLLASLFLAALAGLALDRLMQMEKWGRMTAFGAGLIACTLLVGLGAPTRAFAQWREEVLPVHRQAGRWLGDHLPAGTWIAAGNAGVLPFESSLPTIDMYGLCDRHIGMRKIPLGEGLPGHEKGDGRYVLDRKPEIILFQLARFSEQPLERRQVAHTLVSLSEKEIWEDPRFATDYSLEAVLIDGIYFNFFRHNRGDQ